ncbi:MAG: autotransporter-associated beta strand repeat-containing protein [Thermoguttaceae bacterium]|nr:autotransporter-associated beta strand repeat-containing protein [Thermoguttaceae bacterium]
MKTHVANNAKRISTRILTRGWIAFLLSGAFWASASFAAPVVYTDDTVPDANIAIGADGVEFQLSEAKTYAYTMSGTGAFYKTGDGTLTLNKNGSTFTGDVFLNSGKIKVTAAWTGTKSALGTVQAGRTINVNSGTELIFANQNIFNNAHNNIPIALVVDGGKISNEGKNYNFLQYVTLKNGGNLHAANGNDTWEAYKLQNLSVVCNSDGTAATAATITGANNTHAVFSFGAKSDEVATTPSTIYVEDITASAGSDLIISAKIVDATTVNTGVKTPGEIIKTGAGTLELKNVYSSYSGNLTINAGTVKVTIGSNADNRTGSALGASNVAGRMVTINKNAVLDLAATDVVCDAHADSQLLLVADGGKITNSGTVYNFLHNVTLKNGANMYAADGNANWEAYKIQNLRVERNSDGSAASAVTLTAANKDHAVFTFGSKTSTITTTPASIYVEDITSANASTPDNVSDLTISAKIVDPSTSGTVKQAAPIVKSGAGMLTLSNGGNTFTGDFTINEGKVKLTPARSGSYSALGEVKSGRKITVNSGGELILNRQDLCTDAHNQNPLLFVLDGGTISNEGANYNYLTNLTFKNGGQLNATDGNATWKTFKLHNLNVERSDRADRTPATITAVAGAANATIAFGDISNVIKVRDNNSVSTITVGEITSEDGNADNKSDLIISAVIADPVHTGSGGKKNATQIIKKGAGTMEWTAANTITGLTTISAGTLRLSGAGTFGTGTVAVGASGTLEVAYASPETSVNLASITMSEGSAIKVTSGTVTFGTDDVALNNLSGEAGTITVTNALTLNNDADTQFTGSITAASIEKTGTGTLKLNTGENGLINVPNLTVTGGRLDLKGNATAGITIGPNTVFSPGNSIGKAEIDGTFTLSSDTSVVLMEIGGSTEDENDVMVVTGDLELNNGVICLELDQASGMEPGDRFTAVLHGNNSAALSESDFINRYIRTTDFMFLSYEQLTEGEYAGLYAISGAVYDANAVPEPTAWVLLLLGAFGLMYARKRK